MIATFCGHRNLSNQIGDFSKWLDNILPSLIEGGVTTFYLGNYGDFDHLAAKAVQRQKKIYPNIQSVLILAYPRLNQNQSQNVSCYDKSEYPELLKHVPSRCAIIRRNEWIIQESSLVISGVTHEQGGAAKTLHYAQRKQKVIVQFPVQTQKQINKQVTKAED